MIHRNTILAASAVAVLGGWALFRPEKLFVNEPVQESIPTVSGQRSMTLAEGTFASYAHETSGRAELIQVGDGRFVRLTDFKTSNGPDVHLYLVKGNEPEAGAKAGSFVDLGTLKGNVGDQNYKLPADIDPKAYPSVAVWCKRFNVGFGGATLTPTPVPSALLEPSFHLAGLGGDIKVTSGKLAGGTVALIERDGKRFLQAAKINLPKSGLRLWLVKAETLRQGLVKAPHVDLGAAKKSGLYPVSKDFDAWLFRTVALVDAKGNAIATAELRSDQEHASI